MCLWDAAETCVVGVFDRAEAQLRGLAWSRSGSHLAIASGDQEGSAKLRAAVDALRADGAEVEVVTGGGTGTVQVDCELGLLTELQPGSYVFMDREYGDALGDDEDGRFETSFFVQSSVVSANAPAFVTLDAGLKAFATDAGVPVAAGAWAGATYFFFGDEQGGLMRVEGRPIALGDRVELTAPHIDPTVDRYERLHLCRGDLIARVVPVEARGRSA